MNATNPSPQGEMRSATGAAAKAKVAEKAPDEWNTAQWKRFLRRRSALTWTHDEGAYGGTCYYYKIKGKIYSKFIPNWHTSPITYGEVLLPENLGEVVAVEQKGIHGACIAGGQYGKHTHFLSATKDYCSVAKNIAYTGK